MRRMMWMAGLVVALAPGASRAAPVELLTNGGFEASSAGSFFVLNQVPGWSGGPVAVVANSSNGVFLAFPSVPTTQGGGTNAALLSPLGVLDQSISQSFSTGGNTQVEISFQYFIQSLDLPLFGDAPADPFTVTAGNLTLLNTSQNDAPGGGASQSGWQTFNSGPIPVSLLGPGGTYTLNFNLNNTNSLNESTRVFIDNASVIASPEPATMAVFGLMAAGAGVVARRRKRATVTAV